MLKGRRSILSSHTAATGLAKLCPTSTSRMPWKTAGPDTLPLVPSTLDPSRLLRWSACPPSTSLTNYIFWRRITGISQKRRIVRSVGPPPHFALLIRLKNCLSFSCSCSSWSRATGPSFIISVFSLGVPFRRRHYVRSFWFGSKSYRTNIKLRSSYIT